MKFDLPPAFPQAEFWEFGKLASEFFPEVLSENLDDLLQKRLHFQRAWLAVCYRYRTCAEYNVTFKRVFDKAMCSDLWREWSEGEEHHYALEESLYCFFMNALSVFESLGFCLYFLGSTIDPEVFSKVENPKHIKLSATLVAFESVFPHASLTTHLNELLQDPAFRRIAAIRNILAHRLIGRRHIHSSSYTDPNGLYTMTREEFWYIPDLNERIAFDQELVQRHFDDVTRLLTRLLSASLEFLKSAKSANGE